LAPVPGPAHRRRGQRTGPTGPIAPRLGAGAPATGPYPADRGLRQGVESAFHALTDVLGLTFPRARTPGGLLARVGAKVAAHDLALLLNHRFDRPAFALFDPLG